MPQKVDTQNLKLIKVGKGYTKVLHAWFKKNHNIGSKKVQK